MRGGDRLVNECSWMSGICFSFYHSTCCCGDFKRSPPLISLFCQSVPKCRLPKNPASPWGVAERSESFKIMIAGGNHSMIKKPRSASPLAVRELLVRTVYYSGRVRSSGCFLKFVVTGGFYPPLRFEQGTRHHSPNCSIPQAGGSTYSSTYRACANVPSALLYFAPYFTTRKGVIQAFDCKQNAARANFRRAALGYFIFLAFAATAFASAIISRC